MTSWASRGKKFSWGATHCLKNFQVVNNQKQAWAATLPRRRNPKNDFPICWIGKEFLVWKNRCVCLRPFLSPEGLQKRLETLSCGHYILITHGNNVSLVIITSKLFFPLGSTTNSQHLIQKETDPSRWTRHTCRCSYTVTLMQCLQTSAVMDGRCFTRTRPFRFQTARGHCRRTTRWAHPSKQVSVRGGGCLAPWRGRKCRVVFFGRENMSQNEFELKEKDSKRGLACWFGRKIGFTSLHDVWDPALHFARSTCQLENVDKNIMFTCKHHASNTMRILILFSSDFAAQTQRFPQKWSAKLCVFWKEALRANCSLLRLSCLLKCRDVSTLLGGCNSQWWIKLTNLVEQ